ncbi:T9SS type A sorting domain-containing protein [Mucilaginibacter polytrichastri]|uniref:Secretion system C-terminal sorting domain-containing protein n=1 Tax=Mucilaginibacter polytrichastri TaxID=1302689 RepID=A0A1Q5ZVE4_9SPHI|nr:T9SS type A sorting domain-containing protein [Mucilaginibacter polytrichastri]OKS85747.1 hypothetical protein RG47T_1193 [Mucilaginibacter polytrichastri]SFS61706.1 Por secretion system C-terminal sorting domain-containing protein [Mucilaginibacter polytrichastri]
MKKLLLPAFLLLSGLADAQIINFPDANLKTKLLAEISALSTGYDQNGDAVLIDFNGDGEIEAVEAAAIYGLNISGASVSNLSGLEVFINLEWIQCGVNQITSLNTSMFPNLKNLMCGYNPITTLDLTGFTQLEILDCEYAQITSLNVAGMQGLKSLRCSGNALTTLDLSGLSSLEEFTSAENPITSLNFDDAVNLSQLTIRQSMLTELDLTHSPLLAYIGFSENPLLETINLKNNGAALVATECQFNNNPNLVSVCVDDGEEETVAQCNWWPTTAQISSTCSFLDTETFAAKKIELFPNPSDGLVTVHTGFEIKFLELYDLQGRLLQQVTAVQGNTSIDVSNLQNGEYLLKVYTEIGSLSKKILRK